MELPHDLPSSVGQWMSPASSPTQGSPPPLQVPHSSASALCPAVPTKTPTKLTHLLLV